MQNRSIPLAIVAALIAAVACGGTTDPVIPSHIVTFKATMTAANEVPANASTGTGTFTATLDTITSVFTYDLTFTGLSAPVTLGHIHGPAAVGVSAGTTIDFVKLPAATFDVGLTTGKGHGAAVLNASTAITPTVSGDSLKKLLFAGLTYANVHTSANPAGEIRGQISKQ